MKIIDLQTVAKPDVTLIPNSVLDQFLPEANELQLKVYLYILRNMHSTAPIQISVMADYFNETEKDITRAFSFWEKRGVFACGQTNAAEQKPSPAVTKEFLTQKLSFSSVKDFLTVADNGSIGTDAGTSTLTASADSTAASDNLSQTNSQLFADAPSRDSFQQFIGSPDFEELTFVAESYMGKPLSRNDLQILIFIKENLGLSNELIDFLLQHCAECGKKSFHYVQKVACEWAKQGITTPEEAQLLRSGYSKQTYSIMNALGKTGSITKTELDYIQSWYQSYGFDTDVILEACRRTVLATDSNRFPYADKILSSWHKADVHHVADIARVDTAYRDRKKQTTSRKAPAYAANNPFLQHQSSNVDYAALEKELLS